MHGAHYYPNPSTVLGGEAQELIEPAGTTLDNAFGTAGDEGYYVAHVFDSRIDIEFVRFAGSWASASFNGFILREVGDSAPDIVQVELMTAFDMAGLVQSDITWGPDEIRVNIAGISTSLDSSCSLIVTFAPACEGDVTGDGLVNFEDLNEVLDNWNTAGPDGDANGDGAVNFEDLNEVLDAWATSC